MIIFKATIEIIGVNPYVSVPEEVLNAVFIAAGKDKGFIPIKGTVNNLPYTQTLVRFKGKWRLYINTSMLKNSPKRIGEEIEIRVAYDPISRKIEAHPKFTSALAENLAAKEIYEQLRPSLQHEIVRYLAHLKTEASLEKNIQKAIQFLLGKERFIGRDKP